MKLLTFIMTLLLASGVFAAKGEKSAAQKIQQATDMFHLSQMLDLGLKTKSFSDDCFPERKNCQSVVCDKLPSYLCDEISELRRVSQICSKVRSADCIEEACQKLPGYLCDEFSELERIAGLCANVPHQSISTVCSYLPSYLCDEISELQRISNIVSNANRNTMQCLKFSCEKLPGYLCDEVSEIEKVIKSCQGN